jgi:hypothetical protein
MSDFWPKGLELSDTQSPMGILENAKHDWNTNSNGALGLVLQETKSTTGNYMIIVHAKHLPSNRTVTLFSVVHRPNAPYPATIEPKGDDLPTFLKKSYYQPGFTENIGGSLLQQGRTVKNSWVSETPSEFRKNLEQVFNLGTVKSEILSLVSSIQRVTDDSGEDNDNDEGEHPEEN